MAKGDKQDVARAKKLVKSGMADPKASVTRGASGKYSAKDVINSSVKGKVSKSMSGTKPSVASKANAKNKMKAQGAKIGSSATSSYNKRGKK